MFDRFWDFNRLVKGGVQGEVEITGSQPLIGAFLGLGFM
jgi:hypothetical protein